MCGRENLIPEIWDVWEKDWEETITNCKKQFAWKLIKRIAKGKLKGQEVAKWVTFREEF